MEIVGKLYAGEGYVQCVSGTSRIVFSLGFGPTRFESLRADSCLFLSGSVWVEA